MIKLSINKTKWSSLLARTRALILYISIWILDFGPEKLPGLSRNGPLVLNTKKNLILTTTCENGLIDKASRKFVNFNSQSLSESFCSPRRKDFRLSRRERNEDEVLQGKFVAWPFDSPTKRQLSTLSTSTFHLYILSVHFDLTRKEIFSIWLNFTTLAFVGVHQWANGWWLTNQSERVYCRNL